MKTIKVVLATILLVGFMLLFAQKETSTTDKLRATIWWDGSLPKWVSYIKFSKTGEAIPWKEE